MFLQVKCDAEDVIVSDACEVEHVVYYSNTKPLDLAVEAISASSCKYCRAVDRLFVTMPELFEQSCCSFPMLE
ncbi:hypothetical protein DPMN_065870 [Dreissena polymorpha]|uniref:Uncharacterized protein n=1 Tax=Dreissena polymorpha TaxID=45954 RepID=A0A9D3YSZ0_DREPO|nr:hypothetical protein DPMN_065870 [Dreissena polymorpha]